MFPEYSIGVRVQLFESGAIERIKKALFMIDTWRFPQEDFVQEK